MMPMVLLLSSGWLWHALERSAMWRLVRMLPTPVFVVLVVVIVAVSVWSWWRRRS